MIVLFRSNSVTGPRVSKYINFYKANSIDYKVIGWDRLGEHPVIDNYEFFEYKSEYNHGGLQAVRDKSHWMRFVYDYIKSHDNITTVHACDVDTAFPASFLKKKKGFNFIFDVCDWNTDLYQDKWLKFAFSRMEKRCVRTMDNIIICEPERIEQIENTVKLPKKPYIMRNIPDFKSRDILFDEAEYHFDNDKVTVAFVGGLGYGRLLDELLDCAEQGIVNLNIAGFGIPAMEERCRRLNDLSNVHYFGKVVYAKGLNILYNSDLVYAMYSKYIPNHIYAAPNKYYEAMFVGKPLLSTKGIKLEKRVESENVGFTIGETKEEIEDFLKSIKKENLVGPGESAKLAWERYKNMTAEFMKEYATLIR